MTSSIFLVLIPMSVFWLVSIIGQRYYQYNRKCLCIKSSKKFLSPQELMILCGSLGCVSIPFLLLLDCDSSISKQVLNDILSNPVAIIFAAAMLLCPLGISLISIYIIISNFIKSFQSDFVKKIILDNTLNCIKVYYSNNRTQIVPFDEIRSFKVYKTITDVPNVRPGVVRAGLRLGGPIVGAGVLGAQSRDKVGIVTDIKIIISTIYNKEIRINTIGNVLFDANSEKLVASLSQYKTKFKKFYIQ